MRPLAIAAVAFALLAAANAATATSQQWQAHAYGIFVDVQEPFTTLGVTVPPRPVSHLDYDGMAQADMVAGADVPLVATSTRAIATSASFGYDPVLNLEGAISRAVAHEVSLLGGIITASEARAVANGALGSRGGSAYGYASFVDLVVMGTPIVGTVPPNTFIPIPGGYVMLNEVQSFRYSWNGEVVLVNAIHVRLDGSLGATGDIVVSSAYAGTGFDWPPHPPPPGQDLWWW